MKTRKIFRRSLQFAILLGTLGMAACSSSDFKRSGSSALDGTWRETAVECVTHGQDVTEKQINEALNSGQVSSVMQIDGSHAVTKVQTWATRDRASGEGRGYCEITLQQRWDVIANHVQVTDVSAEQKSYKGNNCRPGRLELHDPRVHNFILLGNSLKVYMNTAVAFNPTDHVASIRSTNCPMGEPVVVSFQRD